MTKNHYLQEVVDSIVQTYGVRIAATSLHKIDIPFEEAYRLIFHREPRL